jgi:hypothetical protein
MAWSEPHDGVAVVWRVAVCCRWLGVEAQEGFLSGVKAEIASDASGAACERASQPARSTTPARTPLLSIARRPVMSAFRKLDLSKFGGDSDSDDAAGPPAPNPVRPSSMLLLVAAGPAVAAAAASLPS